MTGTATLATDLPVRLRAVRAAMAAQQLDALVLVSPENVYYLAGLNHYGYFATTLLLVPADGPLQLVARAMELPTLRAQVPDCVPATYGDDADPADAAAVALRSMLPAGGRVGVEQDTMNLPVRVWRRLESALPDVEWSDCTPLLFDLRAVKSPAEIAQVRAAAAMSDRALQAGIAAAVEGVHERDVAAEIYQALIDSGSDAPACPPFIRASEDIPLEHVTWRGDRVLRRNDRVFFELGASAARYHAPTSRIVYVGEQPAGVDDAAAVVLAGFDALLATLRPGVAAGDVYAAWQRAVADALGDDGYHRHHCGYLTGLGFPPTWTGSSTPTGLRRGSDLVVREGMVFHVMSWLLGRELPDYGVSDTAVVTADGCDLLTTTTRTPLTT